MFVIPAVQKGEAECCEFEASLDDDGGGGGSGGGGDAVSKPNQNQKTLTEGVAPTSLPWIQTPAQQQSNKRSAINVLVAEGSV
jgi:hypothetical protein